VDGDEIGDCSCRNTPQDVAFIEIRKYKDLLLEVRKSGVRVSAHVKRIEEICNEFDGRMNVVGTLIARLELAHSLVEREEELGAAQRRIKRLEEFVIGVRETLELHESNWGYHLRKDLDDLEEAVK